MLRLRLSEGLPLAELSETARSTAEGYLKTGHLARDAWDTGRLVLTRDGRLLADALIRDLT